MVVLEAGTGILRGRSSGGTGSARPGKGAEPSGAGTARFSSHLDHVASASNSPLYI